MAGMDNSLEDPEINNRLLRTFGERVAYYTRNLFIAKYFRYFGGLLKYDDLDLLVQPRSCPALHSP
jgi:hypothetical protein